MRFQEVINPIHNSETTIPARQTRGSAGYDFHIKEDMEIKPNETKLTFTDVKCKLNEKEVLLLFVRSSVGIKRRLALAHGTGVIDADYYGNKDNDGNIAIPIFNYGNETVHLKAGERLVQGVIVDYKADEDVVTTRTGGFGSTN